MEFKRKMLLLMYVDFFINVCDVEAIIDIFVICIVLMKVLPADYVPVGDSGNKLITISIFFYHA